jgi:hypothetical protein
MKLRERFVHREPGNTELGRQSARRRQSRRVLAKISQSQFVPNLTIKLMMEWLRRRPIQPDHFEGDERSLASSIRSCLPHDQTDAASSVNVHSETSSRDHGIQLACAVPFKWLWRSAGKNRRLVT